MLKPLSGYGAFWHIFARTLPVRGTGSFILDFRCGYVHFLIRAQLSPKQQHTPDFGLQHAGSLYLPVVAPVHALPSCGHTSNCIWYVAPRLLLSFAFSAHN